MAEAATGHRLPTLRSPEAAEPPRGNHRHGRPLFLGILTYGVEATHFSRPSSRGLSGSLIALQSRPWYLPNGWKRSADYLCTAREVPLSVLRDARLDLADYREASRRRRRYRGRRGLPEPRAYSCSRMRWSRVERPQDQTSRDFSRRSLGHARCAPKALSHVRSHFFRSFWKGLPASLESARRGDQDSSAEKGSGAHRAGRCADCGREAREDPQRKMPL